MDFTLKTCVGWIIIISMSLFRLWVLYMVIINYLCTHSWPAFCSVLHFSLVSRNHQRLLLINGFQSTFCSVMLCTTLFLNSNSLSKLKCIELRCKEICLLSINNLSSSHALIEICEIVSMTESEWWGFYTFSCRFGLHNWHWSRPLLWIFCFVCCRNALYFLFLILGFFCF